MNIIEYAEKELDSFGEKAFNQVDSLILSQLAYMHFDDIVPGLGVTDGLPSIAELFKAELFNLLLDEVRDPKSNKRLLFAVAASPRFRDIRLCSYVNKLDYQEEKQFCALTYLLPGKEMYVAFRGTDANIVGWKEDFNMAFISPVPAQREGLAYLNDMAVSHKGAFMVGGHSKGGNLAVYAAMSCKPEIQKRIKAVFSHDGPGFKSGILEEANFSAIKEKVYKTLPTSSRIGMLLENQESYAVVESDRLGIMQHDPFSWKIKGDGFVYAERISSGARYFNENLSLWLSELDDAKRELFIDTVFEIISAGQAKTYYEFSANWQKETAAVLKAVKNLDAQTSKFVFETIGILLKMPFRIHRLDEKIQSARQLYLKKSSVAEQEK